MKATLYVVNKDTGAEEFAAIVDVDEAAAKAQEFANNNNAQVVGYRADDEAHQFPIRTYPPSAETEEAT